MPPFTIDVLFGGCRVLCDGSYLIVEHPRGELECGEAVTVIDHDPYDPFDDLPFVCTLVAAPEGIETWSRSGKLGVLGVSPHHELVVS